jgi:hypothetical protein
VAGRIDKRKDSVTDHLFLVFSNPVSGQEDAYHAWYERHVRDLVRVPGFRSAQRYSLVDDRGDPREHPYAYVVAYELEGDVAEAFAALRQAVVNGAAEAPDPACVESDIYGHVYAPVGERLGAS